MSNIPDTRYDVCICRMQYVILEYQTAPDDGNKFTALPVAVYQYEEGSSEEPRSRLTHSFAFVNAVRNLIIS